MERCGAVCSLESVNEISGSKTTLRDEQHFANSKIKLT